MESTGNGQSSSATAETETGRLSKARIELSTEIDGENHGLGFANLCLSFPVVVLAFVSSDIYKDQQVSCPHTTSFLCSEK